MFASAITVVFKDFQKILSAIIRLLFYISPIVWDQSNLPEAIQDVFKWNPFAYVLQGYRNAVLYGVSIGETLDAARGFWVLTVVLFLLGSSVHMKFRRKFMDLI